MQARWFVIGAIAFAIGGAVWFACAGRTERHPPPPNLPPPISQDVYVWQRAWTPAVRAAIGAQASHFRRFVILSAEISLRGEGKATEVHPDYAALAGSVRDIGLAIRIGPLPAGSMAMQPGSVQTTLIADTAANAVDQARRAGLQVSEVQTDYDCAESKLAGYLNWVKAVRSAVSPATVVVTALPSWLKHQEFADLARETGSYVLQVHSLHKPAGPDAPMNLCDADEARAAVAEAGKIGIPFRVALPTYSYLAGFSADGKLLGLSAEGPEPAWPGGTILRTMRSDPDSLADLVRQWSSSPPPAMTGLIWYRLPVSGETMNWRAVTLDAVMAGRPPKADVAPVVSRPSPGLLDIYLRNTGDADGTLQCSVTVSWVGADLVAAEGIGGFEHLDAPAGGVTFRATDIPVGRWIAPGEQIQVGWLRLNADKEVRTNVSPLSPG